MRSSSIKSVSYTHLPCILCQISISHRYRDSRFVLFFQCIIKSPAHDAHKGGIFKLHATLDILWQYNGAVMIPFMAGDVYKRQLLISRGLSFISNDIVSRPQERLHLMGVKTSYCNSFRFFCIFFLLLICLLYTSYKIFIIINMCKK